MKLSSVPVPDLRGVPVLVTGGAGFIGGHLVEALVARGARVRVLDDFSTGRPQNLAAVADAVEIHEGDIARAADVARAVAGVRYVFHQAALSSVPGSFADPASTHRVNAAGSANVFDAARAAGAARVIWASSSAVYGDCEDLPAHEDRTGAALSPYAASKQEGERLAAERAAGGQQLVGLRYFNIYGPRQDPNGPYAAVVPRFLAALRAGQAPVIHGDGEQTRDFLFVADAVLANLMAAGADDDVARAGVFNVASGRATSIRELAALATAACGGGPPPRFEAARPGEIRHSRGDMAAFRAAIGELPLTSLQDGLGRCVS